MQAGTPTSIEEYLLKLDLDLNGTVPLADFVRNAVQLAAAAQAARDAKAEAERLARCPCVSQHSSRAHRSVSRRSWRPSGP